MTGARTDVDTDMQGYDISFLITNFHTEEMLKHKLVDFIIEFMEEVDKEISEMKLFVCISEQPIHALLRRFLTILAERKSKIRGRIIPDSSKCRMYTDRQANAHSASTVRLVLCLVQEGSDFYVILPEKSSESCEQAVLARLLSWIPPRIPPAFQMQFKYVLTTTSGKVLNTRGLYKILGPEGLDRQSSKRMLSPIVVKAASLILLLMPTAILLQSHTKSPSPSWHSPQ